MNGNAASAIDFYCKALSGKVAFSQTYKNAPFEVPADLKSKIMHATLEFNGTILQISDCIGEPAKAGSNLSISINTHEAKHAAKMFQNLAEGGNITIPLEKQFWGSLFGQVEDKFGIQWIVNCATQSNDK
jgi:PhnB protein